MNETSAKPVYCHKCGKDVSGVGFVYHLNDKVACHECTFPATKKEQADGRNR